MLKAEEHQPWGECLMDKPTPATYLRCVKSDQEAKRSEQHTAYEQSISGGSVDGVKGKSTPDAHEGWVRPTLLPFQRP